MSDVKLTIDGVEIVAKEGMSILEAALDKSRLEPAVCVPLRSAAEKICRV
jgi:NADH dehydrogenase/NADH:ubiquinone oxidoreductase subunit G